MSHKRNRRPEGTRAATQRYNKNTSYGKGNSSTARLVSVLWIQNSLVLLSLVLAMAVTR